MCVCVLILNYLITASQVQYSRCVELTINVINRFSFEFVFVCSFLHVGWYRPSAILLKMALYISISLMLDFALFILFTFCFWNKFYSLINWIFCILLTFVVVNSFYFVFISDFFKGWVYSLYGAVEFSDSNVGFHFISLQYIIAFLFFLI